MHATMKRFTIPNHDNPRRPHAAFTLVELLVTIAIIGILASILLPALLRAREWGRTIVCVGQERQIMQMTTIYMDDFGQLPGAPNAPYDWNFPWINAANTDNYAVTPPSVPSTHWTYTRSLLDPYGLYSMRSQGYGGIANNRYSVYCPTLFSMSFKGSYGINPPMMHNQTNWYDDAYGEYNVHPKNARYPSKAGVYSESTGPDYGGGAWGPRVDGLANFARPTFCHGVGLPPPGEGSSAGIPALLFSLGSMNYAFLDGHVDTIPYKKANNHWPEKCIPDWDFRAPNHSPDM